MNSLRFIRLAVQNPHEGKRVYLVSDNIPVNMDTLMELAFMLDASCQRIYVTTGTFAKVYFDVDEWPTTVTDDEGQVLHFDEYAVQPLFYTYGHLWVQSDLLTTTSSTLWVGGDCSVLLTAVIVFIACSMLFNVTPDKV